MKVYVAEKGCYEDRFVEGVYTTAEAAMAANPIPAKLNARDVQRPGGWRTVGDDNWDNGLDWGEAVHVWPAEVEG